MHEREVLIVDADERALAMLARGFRHAGWNVTAASRLDEALTALARRPPALVLSEIELSEDSGLELCEKIKRDVFASSIPFYFVTKLTTPGLREVALEAGASDVVNKPRSSATW